MNKFSPAQPGTINVAQDAVIQHYAEKGNDAWGLAKGWIEAWAAKAEPGTQVPLAKMKCMLADGGCGCPEDSSVYKCTGPYPPVPIEIIVAVLEKGDVKGVELLTLPAPEAVITGGSVHFAEFVGPHSLLVDGPAQVKYIKKL